MSIHDAIFNRRSIRAFSDEPVDISIVTQCFEDALWAPSGSNMQPFYVDIVSGEKRDQLVQRAEERLSRTVEPDPEADDFYPKYMPEPLSIRRIELAQTMYSIMGVERDNREQRDSVIVRNIQLFDAPVAAFISLPPDMTIMQWGDAGIFVQTVMLLLHEHGIGSCPQAVWSRYPSVVSQTLGWKEKRTIYCGMSIGIAQSDHPLNTFERQRAQPSEIITIHT